MTMTNSMLNHCCDYVNVKSGRRALCAPNLWSKLEIYALCFPVMLDRVNCLESSCVHIEYVKKSGYTSESKGTQLLLYDQNVPFCNQTRQVDWAGSDNNTNNIEQLLTAWCSLEQVLLWSFALLWALKPAKVDRAGSAVTGSNAVSIFKRWGKVKPYKVLQNASNMYLH